MEVRDEGWGVGCSPAQAMLNSEYPNCIPSILCGYIGISDVIHTIGRGWDIIGLLSNQA